MASVFAVTTATTDLEATSGAATAVFVVTNATARPLRGIAKIKPLEKTQAEWLKVDGETERDFPAGGTHQFTVTFNRPKPPAPPGVPLPAETFPFRFDAVSAVNPDEDFTEGPVVTVKIPEQKVAAQKSFPWWIIPLAAVLLIVIGVVTWLLLRNGGSGVEVPDVTNKTFAEANTILKNANLSAVKLEPVANNKELNRVFEQDPAAGTKVDVNSNVNVSIPASSNVPRVVGLKYNDAKTKLAQSGFEISGAIQSKDIPDTADPNLVGFQFPLSSTTALKGTEVKVFFPCRNPKCSRVMEEVGNKATESDRKSIIDLLKSKQ
jgi:hypothetical protein